MAATQRVNPAPMTKVRDKVARLLDALAGGASPPGLIDMTPLRSPAPRFAPRAQTDAQLRRRFTMIATFDRRSRNARRWPVSGLIVSLALLAVALTGAVRAQDGQAKTNEAKPQAPDVKAAQPRRPITREQADKLWREKYADRVITVNGREANREQIDREFLEEVGAMGGVEDAAASAQKGGRAGAVDEGESAEDRQVAALLARRVPELNFDAVALTDVIDFLRDVSGANVFVDWGALEGAGIERNTPVSARVRNVPFSNALDLVLASAGKGAVVVGYAFKDGVIHVTTGEQLDRLVETRAYDVRDLVPSEIDMKELGLMVRSSVAPDSWRENGGSVGALHTSKHKMIVTATGPSHRKIREILDMLRDQPRQAKTEEAATAAQGPAAPK
jgi:hypothetical protein